MTTDEQIHHLHAGPTMVQTQGAPIGAVQYAKAVIRREGDI